VCESDPITANRVMEAIDHLSDSGPGLGRPMVRMLFIFDVEREAVILVAGDKAGQWNRWYRENVPRAERLYEEYVIERKGKEKP
jgi:hypothetical protein